MSKSPTAAEYVTAAERAAAVIRFRKAGLTYDEIGEQVGLTKGRISKILKQHLEAVRTKTEEDTEEYVRLENARLDQLWKGIYPQAIRGSLGAIDRAIKIMDRRAKLLGLDAPSKTALTDPTGTKPYAGGGLAALLAASEGQ